MKPIIVIRYGELSLKGKNRNFFENILIRNIERILEGLPVKVKRRFGRLVIFLENDVDQKLIKEKLAKVFGIANFSFGFAAPLNTDDIKADIQTATNTLLTKAKNWESFRVQTKRSNKNFPFRSMELDRIIGGEASDLFPEKKVQLKNPDITIFIEVEHKEVFISGEKHPGSGGLPVGSSADVVCLMSGGIDSPVAAWYAMKRGSRVHFVHFHSAPYTSRASIEKVEDLVAILTEWQGPSTFISIPFVELQKKIITKIKSSYGVLVYRRFMIRTAEIIAKDLKAKALVTGESVGQVASQTLENMAAINDVTRMPIIRPLVSFDKNDIMDLAKRIGTYETSIIPHDDCCSLFVPAHPVIRASIGQTRKQEATLDVKNEIETLIQNAEHKVIK